MTASDARRWFARAAGAALMAGVAAAQAAPVISAGTPFQSPLPAGVPGLEAGSFLLPVEIRGAQALQTWQFDLTFDATVVQVVSSDPFSLNPGLYGARFDPGDDASAAFLLGGFVFNGSGFVDDIAGFYPLLADGITGDGVLAYIEFAYRAGREADDPGFAITGVPESATVPEPATAALVLACLLLAGAARRRQPSTPETTS